MQIIPIGSKDWRGRVYVRVGSSDGTGLVVYEDVDKLPDDAEEEIQQALAGYDIEQYPKATHLGTFTPSGIEMGIIHGDEGCSTPIMSSWHTRRRKYGACTHPPDHIPRTYVYRAHQNRPMTERHFGSEAEIRDFVANVADEYHTDADEWGTYEAATALYDDYDLCPWSITTHIESNVPYDELSGPDPRDMLVHEAYLCLEELLSEIYGE